MAGVHQQNTVARPQPAFKAGLQLQPFLAAAAHMELHRFAFGALVQLFDPDLHLLLHLFLEAVEPGAGVLAGSLGVDRDDLLDLPARLDRPLAGVAFTQGEAQGPAPVVFVLVQGMPCLAHAQACRSRMGLEHQLGGPAGRAFTGARQGPHVGVLGWRGLVLGTPALRGLHLLRPRLAGDVHQGLAGELLCARKALFHPGLEHQGQAPGAWRGLAFGGLGPGFTPAPRQHFGADLWGGILLVLQIGQHAHTPHLGLRLEVGAFVECAFVVDPGCAEHARGAIDGGLQNRLADRFELGFVLLG